MKISGFSFIKNATQLYLPIKQSILSVLPLVDEFVLAMGDNDDDTKQQVESIHSDKIRIIDTVWDYQTYPNGTEFAHQTDIAKQACTGDWLFYIQGDEVLHEKYLPIIQQRCEQLRLADDVDALLFKYVHFWGDYQHYQAGHGWYKNEIRMIRNKPDIHSWKDAQSFRRIPDFDGKNYRQEENTFKLNVASVNAEMFHYGWVRPPQCLVAKQQERRLNYQKNSSSAPSNQGFDFGPLDRLATFTGTHPQVMAEWIKRMDWQDQLQYQGKPNPNRPKHKHERWKYRMVSKLEEILDKPLWESENYTLLTK